MQEEPAPGNKQQTPPRFLSSPAKQPAKYHNMNDVSIMAAGQKKKKKKRGYTV
jgi:hypothetical protein